MKMSLCFLTMTTLAKNRVFFKELYPYHWFKNKVSPKALLREEQLSDKIKPREQWIVSKSSAFTLRNHQPHFDISKYDQLI